MSDRTLLVSVDSIRADHQKYLKRTDKFLDFEEKPVFATAPATYTSFQAIVGGQYASENPSLDVVAEQFDDYSIGITTNNFLSHTYGYDNGFDYFNSPKSSMTSGWKSKVGMMLNPGSRRHKIAVKTWSKMQELKSSVPYLSVARDFRDADSIIDEFDEKRENHSNWFAWLHFMEPHHPYNPPNSQISRSKAKSMSRKVRSSSNTTDSEEDSVRSLYRDEVKLVDRKLERLWDMIPDDTRVVFCSDHGEYLGEGGYWGHGGDLTPTVLKVPLAYKGLNTVPSGDVVSLIDIPSILLGRSSYGKGKTDRSYAYATSDDSKAVLGTEGYVNKNGVFDYDGEEISNDELESKYENFSSSSSSRMDAGVEEDLRSLGYLE